MKHTYVYESCVVHMQHAPHNPCDILTYGPGWIVTSVRTIRAKGKGYAREAMSQVLKDADEEKVPLYLTIDPDPDSSLDPAQLQAWYERLGFEMIKEDPTNRTMARHPR